MATRHRKGTARFDFSEPGGSLESHILAVPLLDLQPLERGSLYEWWSEDLRTSEIVTVGDGVEEFFGTIRFDDQPQALKRMLRLARRSGVTLTYYPDENATGIPLRLVSVVGAGQDETPIAPDPDRAAFNEWMARCHFRRVDGGDLSTLFQDAEP